MDLISNDDYAYETDGDDTYRRIERPDCMERASRARHHHKYHHVYSSGSLPQWVHWLHAVKPREQD